MKKTLGGDRLGSGNKMQVDLHHYNRSTHDMSYLWRSSMSMGTLVPFLCEIGLPGDTFDINLNTEILTLPTKGPLFGSAKVQLDTFIAPIRLYNSLLHNNMLGIGLKMAEVKLPQIELTATLQSSTTTDVDNSQINPSCILSYLGLRGVGTPDVAGRKRSFNAVPLLAYWEIYKNYYANKMEKIGAVIHTPASTSAHTVTELTIDGQKITQNTEGQNATTNPTSEIVITFSTIPNSNGILLDTNKGVFTVEELFGPMTIGPTLTGFYNYSKFGAIVIYYWKYREASDIVTQKPIIETFPLQNLDQMRIDLLKWLDVYNNPGYTINQNTNAPYGYLAQMPGGIPATIGTQEGLGLKTYQSDLFNNWLDTETIDGPNGINEITKIDVSDGLKIDSLLLARKVYDVLNRIAVSGGSYDDWLDAVYTEERYRKCESPMYMGGLIKELVFQEVISNTATPQDPLGTLAGRGKLSNKHKGGSVTIKVEEPSYILGIISITPRIDYSQGNKFDVHLKTMDDLHKPGMDEIGFQELITEQMAWWSTYWNTSTGKWTQKSAGKQPAWLNYMTNVNQTRGNFAVPTKEMFMTFNRRYEKDANGIKDLTTYIDPSKFNFIFAEDSLDAQNYWTQISVDMKVRRKISARLMPNL